MSPLQGINAAGVIHRNYPTPRLIEMALQMREGILAEAGTLVVETGKYSGRSAKDKYVVVHPASKDQVWFGKVNKTLEPDRFQILLDDVRKHLEARPELFVFDGYACADPKHRLKVRVICEHAWHALFAQLLLIRPTDDVTDFVPDITIFHAPDMNVSPQRHGTRSDVAIVLDVDAGQIVIAGTQYAGEIKKSVFSYLNYALPQAGVFPMHCSANVDRQGRTALLFGLSGTGKTTLSADPERALIGDDEHGWSDDGIFNFEGGCYAKCVNLSASGEPQIWQAIRFGSLVENVVCDPLSRRLDFTNTRRTENTRAAYPLDFIPGIEPTSRGTHPSAILFLTCDAFGVLPPLSRLTTEQAMYHFLAGYTAKVAGTEAGVTEPTATFSTCFAAPFLTLPPQRYADMLGQRLERFKTPVWLVNTGWSGGGYGQGQRMKLSITRRVVSAALNGELDNVPMTPDPVFGVMVPQACPGVPSEVLTPRLAWPDPAAYDRQAQKLAKLFEENQKKGGGAAGG